MPRFKPISRRTMIRGSAGALIALPWLEAMASRTAVRDRAGTMRQEEGPPKRVIVMFTPNSRISPIDGGNAVPERWRPTGTETNFTLGEMIEPLSRHRDDLIVLDGIDDQAGVESVSATHNVIGCLFTGKKLMDGPLSGTNGERLGVRGPSVDVVLGERIGQTTKKPFLPLGVGLGRYDQPSATVMWGHSSWAGDNQWVDRIGYPDRLFAELFSDFEPPGEVDPDQAEEMARLRAQRRSVLDGSLAEFQALRTRVSGTDRVRLEAHLEAVRKLEMEIDRDIEPPSGEACMQPAEPGMPTGGWREEDTPEYASAMLDQVALAMACDLTRVVSLQWSRGQTQALFPFLDIGLGYNEAHQWSHDVLRSAEQDALVRIYRWYATQLAELIDRLKAMPEGNGTVFDNTTILWATELGEASWHVPTGHGWVLAGSCGGHFRTGRWVRPSAPNNTTNDVMLSLLQAAGQPDDTFGDPEFSHGPIPGLT